MHEKEIIRLDAKVVGVIGTSAFRAELANGHRIVAFLVAPAMS
jgi:translation initiation factor IF-1